MRVHWTEEAAFSFNDNIAYLIREWNDSVVEDFIDKADEAISSISKHPTLHIVIDKKKRVHRCLVVKQISLFYRIMDDRIELISFWNNYQDPKRLKF